MVQHRAILTMPTNRKSYMVYQTAPFSMTLNDRLPRFQGHDILDAGALEAFLRRCAIEIDIDIDITN